MPDRILIIEDEPRMRRVLELVLESNSYRVETAADGEAGMQKWAGFHPDLVITDLKMPKADGMAVLAFGRQTDPGVPVLILTAFGTIPTAVDAMRQGAFDYITKPVDNDAIVEKVKRALQERLRRKQQNEPSDGITEPPLLIGSSRQMNAVKKELALVAQTNTSVLITGASGTGKELAARTIHALSARKNAPFVRVNCAAIPRELMESELFGHVKGAFTGAFENKIGLFEQADTGILFLDEIGDLPYGLQAKLLHAVEDKVVTPVGAGHKKQVEIKIVSATNQNIQQMVTDKKFRSDLFFRLNTYEIKMPLLNERPGDIPELTDHLLSRICRVFDRPVPRMQIEALEALTCHDWPGNVRELKNVLERVVLVAEGGKITRKMVDPLINREPSGQQGAPEQKTDLLTSEKQMIESVLTACGWNISKSARQLGISRNTLRYRIKKHQLVMPDHLF